MFAAAITLAVLCLMLLATVLWTVQAWPRVRPRHDTDDGNAGSVSVLIPARNEEHNLPRVLESLIAQGSAVREITVLDDKSEDGTADVVRGFMQRDSRIRLISGTPLPEGWTGKNWACCNLAQHAEGEWMLYVDADTELFEGSIAGILAEAKKRDLTFLSCWPGLEMRTFWERALMPMLNFLTFSLYPAPMAESRMQDASLGLAHGACILMHSREYAASGGHSAVRGEIFEDTRLSRLWREKGMRGLCLDGQDVIRVRMYGSFSEIWHGFRKNFYPAFGNAPGFLAFLLLRFAVFQLPLIAAPVATVAYQIIESISAATSITILAMLWVAFSSVMTMRIAMALRFKHPLWSVLLHPVAELILALIALASWFSVLSGKGVSWKGRAYHSSAKRQSAANGEGGS